MFYGCREVCSSKVSKLIIVLANPNYAAAPCPLSIISLLIKEAKPLVGPRSCDGKAHALISQFFPIPINTLSGRSTRTDSEKGKKPVREKIDPAPEESKAVRAKESVGKAKG